MNVLPLLASLVIGQSAEVRYNDGSVVHVKIEQPSIDVATKYGKLTVPVAEIRRIEFGRHWPAGRREQLEALIRSLGSAAFKERDDATKKLFDAGPLAWPLLRAVKSDDVEATKRTDGLLRRIEDAHAREDLDRPTDDTVTTAVFTIAGRIDSAAIKVTSENFGAQDVPLHAVRALTLTAQASEITIDAAVHSGPGQWLDTGRDVMRGQALTILADGQIDLWPQEVGRYLVGPSGFNQNGRNESFLAGALIGRVGTGAEFTVGDRYTVSAGEGRLYLRIAQNPWGGNSSGTFRVRIRGR